jgi:hypothetical protein
MDSDNTTPAARYFVDRSLVLSGTRENRDEAILWLSFRETEGTVFLAVYDDTTKTYTHEFKGETPEAVNAFLTAVEDAYDTTVPVVYAKTVSAFLRLRDKAFGLSLTLEDPAQITTCDQCGDYRGDSIEAFYFPPLSPGQPASVAVDLRYGCYGSKVTAVPAETLSDIDEVIDIIEDGLKRADNDATEQELDAFLLRLVKTLPMDSSCAGFGVINND